MINPIAICGMYEAARHTRSAAVASPARTQSGAIHDARIAALCLHHGVTQLWSADRDFTRFPALAVRNPLLS